MRTEFQKNRIDRKLQETYENLSFLKKQWENQRDDKAWVDIELDEIINRLNTINENLQYSEQVVNHA